MTKEIKEILDKLKDDDWYDELDLTGDKWIELKQTETKQLLDYITNLQQENERLKEEKSLIDGDINNAYSWLRDYKSRVDKAIDFIEWHYKDNKEFYKNKGIGLNYPECDALLNILQNGSDSQ